MLVVIVLGFLVCSLGLQKGVERVTKVMMVCLLGIMVVLVVRAVTLPGGLAGLEFYLVPDFGRLFAGATPAEQWATFGDAVFAAMGQAFFTLSLGISRHGDIRQLHRQGTLADRRGRAHLRAGHGCGAHGRPHHLPGLLRLRGGAGQGPRLVFITLPSVFDQMPLGSCGARCSSCS